MGGCNSNTAKVYDAKASVPVTPCETPEDIRRVFATFAGEAKSTIPEASFDAFYEAVCGEPVDAEERRDAIDTICPTGTIHIDAFLGWFRSDDEVQSKAAKPKEPAPVLESLAKGLKEDGEAVGSEWGEDSLSIQGSLPSPGPPPSPDSLKTDDQDQGQG